VLPNCAYVEIKAAAFGGGSGAAIRGPSPLAGARAPAASPARPPYTVPPGDMSKRRIPLTGHDGAEGLGTCKEELGELDNQDPAVRLV